MFHVNWVRTSLIAMCLCVCVVCITLATFIADLDVSITRTYPELVNSQINALRGELNGQILGLRQDLLAQTSKTSDELMQRLDVATLALNTRLDDTNHIINERLGDFSAIGPSTAGAVSEVSIDVDRITRDVHEVQQRLLEREPKYYSRFLATTGELNKTLDATRLTANEVAKAAPQVADDVTRVTGAVADYVAPKEPPKKPKWYIRWLPTVVVTVGKILF